MKRALPFIIIAVVALLTIGVGAAIYQAKLRQGAVAPSISPPPVASSETGSSTPSNSDNVASAQSASSPEGTPLIIDPGSGLPTPNPEPRDFGLHIRGPRNAPVTMEIWGDFQCPACAINAKVVDELEKEYGTKLRVIFHEFPLEMHNHSVEAARAAEAAGLQGKFWEMHDQLYSAQESWSKASRPKLFFAAYARSMGMDVDKFEADYESPEVAARVKADGQAGEIRGVQNTPTIFINGEQMRSIFSGEKMRELIDAALAAKKS